jgi:hypothetical protein
MTPVNPSSQDDLYRDLTELIDAIDRRLPRLAHVDEPAIAHDAADLRERAAQLLAKLDRARAGLADPPARSQTVQPGEGRSPAQRDRDTSQS